MKKKYKDNRNLSSVARMKDQGYCEKEIKMFQRAIGNNNYRLMKRIKCRCTEEIECEPCKLNRLRKEMRPFSSYKRGK